MNRSERVEARGLFAGDHGFKFGGAAHLAALASALKVALDQIDADEGLMRSVMSALEKGHAYQIVMEADAKKVGVHKEWLYADGEQIRTALAALHTRLGEEGGA